MRKIGTASLLLFLLLVAFATGAYTAIMNYWGQSIVTIRVENISGQEIHSLGVSYTSYGSKGQIEVPPIARDESATMRFYLQGDGSCQITAILEDGTVLRGIGGYIQPGYSLAFKVFSSAIVED